LSRTYRLYGLNIRSDWPLTYPECDASPASPPDLELAEAPAKFFSDKPPAVGEPSGLSSGQRHAQLADGSTYLCWPGLFQFLISADGRRIVGRSIDATSWEAFQTYLLGQVISFALLKQGIEPLHCTAIVVAGEAVGLLGDCGYGKSSLAAAFLKAGHLLLTDDLLVLQENGQGFLAYPSFPRIKLFPEVAQTLFGDKVLGTHMNPYTAKLIIPLAPGLSFRKVAPLKTFFVLRSPDKKSAGKRIIIRSLSPRQAFLALTANTFNVKVREPDRLKRLLDFATLVANKVPVKSLSYPRDLDLLPQVVEAVRLSLAKS
jgi:hypothetical protein